MKQFIKILLLLIFSYPAKGISDSFEIEDIYSDVYSETNDGRGIWKDSASGFFGTPSDIRWISSVSNHSGNWDYNPYDVDGSSTTSGAFANSGHQDFATQKKLVNGWRSKNPTSASGLWG